MAEDVRDITNIESLRAVPWRSLPSSALVDFLLFFASGKPAVRLKLINRAGIRTLAAWCREVGMGFDSDSEGFVCVARKPEEARRILSIDQCLYPHEIQLGQALGYPLCCCERIAALGESNIDAYSVEVATWSFIGPYRRIDPSGYKKGLALVSHLPCQRSCDASLSIANQAFQFVLAHASEPVLYELYHSPVVCLED